MKTFSKTIGLGSILAAALACGSSSSISTPATSTSNIEVPVTYNFERNGATSVSYTGQIARHELISKLKSYTSSLTGAETSDAVLTRLTKLYSGTTHSDESISSTSYTMLQSNIDAISSSKDLQGKTAGNDTVTDIKVWGNGNTFKGWSDTSIQVVGASVSGNGSANISTPEGLVWAFFHKLAEQSGNTSRVDAQGRAITKAYVTEKRQDLNQLIQKFLWGAVTYAQAVDDYLDSDVSGKGLLATQAIGTGKNYTNLEHAWDEAFGYFGAARDLASYTDKEIAGASVSTDNAYRSAFANQVFDTNQDGSIDAASEKLYGHVTYAAKRDLENTSASLNLTKDIFDAFKTGRAIIASGNGSALSSSQLVSLSAQRDIIVRQWEKVLLLTSAHYIDSTLADIDALIANSNDDTALNDYAKHWSELKGFALSLQFNPFTRFTDTQFATLHSQIGDAPVLDSNLLSGFIIQLNNAKSLLLSMANSGSGGSLSSEFASSGAVVGTEAAGDND